MLQPPGSQEEDLSKLEVKRDILRHVSVAALPVGMHLPSKLTRDPATWDGLATAHVRRRKLCAWRDGQSSFELSPRRRLSHSSSRVPLAIGDGSVIDTKPRRLAKLRSNRVGDHFVPRPNDPRFDTKLGSTMKVLGFLKSQQSS